MSMPQWMAKYPCLGCGLGYGQCHESALVAIQCCPECSHPGYREAQPYPWTIEELEEMWAGREQPHYVQSRIRQLRDLARIYTMTETELRRELATAKAEALREAAEATMDKVHGMDGSETRAREARGYMQSHNVRSARDWLLHRANQITEGQTNGPAKTS